MTIVGAGRLGTALSAALREAGYAVDGPLGRGAGGAGDSGRGAAGRGARGAGASARGAAGRGAAGRAPEQSTDAVLLCVPDSEIASAAAHIAPGALVGHCSGASTLDPLAPHEAFSLHPLMTITPLGARFAGAGAAIAGSSPRALSFARGLADSLGMRPVEIADADRAAYHAAASIASNFLITLEAAAERVIRTAGADRSLIEPLVRATVESWARLGPQRALTGPVARGDEETVARQRAAIGERAADLLALFDAFVAATRALAREQAGAHTRSTRTAAARLQTLRTVAELREALAAHRRAGETVGLVPTMGAFHEGHLSLMRQAQRECERTVVSLFVNPAQFNDPRDLEAYPRDEARDAQLAAQTGVDYLFAPLPSEVYPSGFATSVTVSRLTQPLEGLHRGLAHFDGVTTVVTKLLNMVGPDVAYFGQKDAQQAIVIRRLVRDLDMPVRIEICPTVREPDGLAMSSRNVRLSPDERRRAAALNRALDAVAGAIAAGEREPDVAIAAGRTVLVSSGIEPEYLELVSPETLAPVAAVEGVMLAAVAARIGTTRLIDNHLIHPLSTAQAAGSTDNSEMATLLGAPTA